VGETPTKSKPPLYPLLKKEGNIIFPLLFKERDRLKIPPGAGVRLLKWRGNAKTSHFINN
jgi:hypothetical protein